MSKKAASTKSAPKEAGASNGATVKDVPAGEFIAALAAHFKKSAKIEVPEWADIVKTGTFKELCPQDPDWSVPRTRTATQQQQRRAVGSWLQLLIRPFLSFSCPQVLRARWSVSLASLHPCESECSSTLAPAASLHFNLARRSFLCSSIGIGCCDVRMPKRVLPPRIPAFSVLTLHDGGRLALSGDRRLRMPLRSTRGTALRARDGRQCRSIAFASLHPWYVMLICAVVLVIVYFCSFVKPLSLVACTSAAAWVWASSPASMAA
jgi:hypothetical protein